MADLTCRVAELTSILLSRYSAKHPCQALCDVLQHWWSERWSLSKLGETDRLPQSLQRSLGEITDRSWGSTWLSFHSGTSIPGITRNQTSIIYTYVYIYIYTYIYIHIMSMIIRRLIFNNPLNTTNQSSTLVETLRAGHFAPPAVTQNLARRTVQIQHRHISTLYDIVIHCDTLWYISIFQ